MAYRQAKVDDGGYLGGAARKAINEAECGVRMLRPLLDESKTLSTRALHKLLEDARSKLRDAARTLETI